MLRYYNIHLNLSQKATNNLPLKAIFWHTCPTFLVNKCKFVLLGEFANFLVFGTRLAIIRFQE